MGDRETQEDRGTGRQGDKGREIGYGFLEKVYEHPMMIEVCRGRACPCPLGIPERAQAPIEIYYDDGEVIEEYSADILVDDIVGVTLAVTHLKL